MNTDHAAALAERDAEIAALKADYQRKAEAAAKEIAEVYSPLGLFPKNITPRINSIILKHFTVKE